MLGSTLHALHPYALAGIVAALIVGGIVKGIVSIGVPLVAMPILSQMMPVKQAVLLLSMPVILGNIPQALEGGDTLATARRMAAPLIGTVLGNILGVSILISLEPHHAQAAAGGLLVFAALLLLASPKFTLAPGWVKPVGFVLGFGAALMESIASIPGPLLAIYLIASGHVGMGVLELIWGSLVVVGASDYVIRPRLVGGHGNMPALLTFAALFGGIEVFGLVGLIVGPLIMSLSYAVLKIFAQEARERRALRGSRSLPPPPVRRISP